MRCIKFYIYAFALSAFTLTLTVPPSKALADCSSPTGVEGEVLYNATHKLMQFCDGTDWYSMSGTVATSNDPRLGTLTASKWCAVDAGGTTVNCDQDAPAASAGADKQIIFNDGGTALAGAAQLFWDKINYRLGIGTANPPNTVTLNETSPSLGLTNTTSSRSAAVGLNSGVGYFYTTGADDILIGANGFNNNIRINASTGNVGIGTATPSTPLEVVGTVKAASGLVWSANGSTATSRSLLLENFDDTANANGVDIGVKLGGTEFQGLSWAQETPWTSGSAAADKDVMLQLGVLNDNTPTNRVFIKANGNVGMGTTNPTYGLTLNNASTSNTGSMYIQAALNSSGKGLVIDSNTRTTADAGIAALEIISRTNTPTLVATVGGNVGIGTTDPTYGLTLNNASTSNTGSMYIQAALNSSGKGLVIDSNTRTTADAGIAALEIISRTNTPTLVATVGGNVGIGTTTPAAALEVKKDWGGSPPSQIALHATGAGTAGIAGISYLSQGYSDANPWMTYAYNSATGRFCIGKNGINEPFCVLDNGSIGVGLSNPGTYKMYVAGALRATEFHDGDIAATGTTNYLCYSGVGLFGTCSSSIVYKENVGDLQLGLDLVMKLRPRSFDWKEDKRHDLGFIAEEVEQIEPLLVRYEDKDDGTKATGVKYEQMPAVLVKAIQELKAENDELRRRLERIESALSSTAR